MGTLNDFELGIYAVALTEADTAAEKTGESSRKADDDDDDDDLPELSWAADEIEKKSNSA